MTLVPTEYVELRLFAFRQKDEIERLNERIAELVGQLATAQSRLGDARAELKVLEGAVDAHYEGAFGHSACFERDEKLWEYLTAKDGKKRKWVRDSIPPEQEHRIACDLYRCSLFQKPESA